MKEILAENLKPFFDNTHLAGTCTYKGKIYEVWEVSDQVFDIMDEMGEEEFVKACPEGMWRYSSGSIFGTPCVDYEINGNKIIAWDDRRERYIEDCFECPLSLYSYKGERCKRTEEDYLECFGERKYKSLLEYLCEEMSCSAPRNVCALSKDLAKYNGITLGELFRKYEG